MPVAADSETSGDTLVSQAGLRRSQRARRTPIRPDEDISFANHIEQEDILLQNDGNNQLFPLIGSSFS